jgi:hypothetical protein
MGSTEVCGISAAKLATVVRIRLTPADPCRENRIADVRCLQQGPQVLVDVRDDTLDLLQSARTRVRFVFVVERRQQI